MVKKNMLLYSVIFLCSLGFVFVEIFESYIFKAICKLFFGIIIPCIFGLYNKNIIIKDFLKFRKEGIKNGILIGIMVFVIVIANFFITKDIIDYSGMLNSIEIMSNGSLIKLLLIDFHIVFINAFIEEFFFRGFVYRNLEGKKYAILCSSFLFALYHSFMIFNWFDSILNILILVGLMIVGIIFIKLNEKSKNIYSSWFVHMSANLALNIAGLILVLENNLLIM